MKNIRSSWNSDRVAACVLNKTRKVRTARPKSAIKVYKTSELYLNKYGNEAYEAWIARDAQIKEMSRDVKKWSKNAIIGLYRQSFLMMKEKSTQRELIVDEHGQIIIRKLVNLPSMKVSGIRLVA
jgi:hypothetical protein